MSGRIWIYSTVEYSTDLDEEYCSVDRAEWEAMSPGERDAYLVDVAVNHQNNVAPSGAQVVEESEVPDDWKQES